MAAALTLSAQAWAAALRELLDAGVNVALGTDGMASNDGNDMFAVLKVSGLPGAITRVMVSVGDAVDDGDGLVVLEAMKMEHTLRSGGVGTVTRILCAPGDQVDVGDVLVVVEPE